MRPLAILLLIGLCSTAAPVFQRTVTLTWNDRTEPALKPYTVFNVWGASQCVATLVTQPYATNQDGTVNYMAAYVPIGVRSNDWRWLGTTANNAWTGVVDNPAGFYAVTASNWVTRMDSFRPTNSYTRTNLN